MNQELLKLSEQFIVDEVIAEMDTDELMSATLVLISELDFADDETKLEFAGVGEKMITEISRRLVLGQFENW